MRKATKIALAGATASVAAVAVALACYGWGQSGAGTGHGARSGAAQPVNTSPPSSQEVLGTARQFLAAWQSQNTAKAAALTDDAARAGTQLTSFDKGLHTTSLTLTGKPPTGFRVPFSVRAQLAYAGRKSTWTYDSSLTVARGTDGRAVVKWMPSVLHPNLVPGQSVVAAASGAPPVKAVDRTGKELTAARYPSLAGILGQLSARYGTKTQGLPGTEIRVENADGSAGRVLKVLSQGRAGKPLPTTIDANLQAEAEKDVRKQGPDASVVAVRPSTGDVLAVAMTPAKGYDKALQGAYAPGSTFKVITASTLLETGKFTPGTPLNCPQYFSYGGLTFHNVDKMKIDHATFGADFAASCNTAFMSTAKVLPDGAVEHEARDVFGLGLNWSTGVPSFDGSVPTTGGASKAMTYIGQGKVLVSPLDMASVAATAKAGRFHQPVIVPASVDNRRIAQAPGQLSARADASLRDLMKLTAREGTAAPTIGGLNGDVGAKTGTAEVDGRKKPDSWFVAYRDDVAAAAVVPDSGEGYKFAGKIVTALLAAS
ncbi:penicillin-binding transpeptidase domain-containing protein [Streptomyces sp. FXJ1.172]|uniref:penicillin-binding transpeptidase domain-containing protein n=1 Tax=Streptomyces sp. FXJ1.172 TaxID=710705 RepID=UPI0007D03C56|nr:penicillin-binding transpeptidase domain-containing protein [Streptomyces sp. FXJ1.172]WEO99694.1 penicillin-binding transpeptidase domain-containing protein [Streptomyces sp. FXJ1.172]